MWFLERNKFVGWLYLSKCYRRSWLAALNVFEQNLMNETKKRLDFKIDLIEMSSNFTGALIHRVCAFDIESVGVLLVEPISTSDRHRWTNFEDLNWNNMKLWTSDDRCDDQSMFALITFVWLMSSVKKLCNNNACDEMCILFVLLFLYPFVYLNFDFKAFTNIFVWWKIKNFVVIHITFSSSSFSLSRYF